MPPPEIHLQLTAPSPWVVRFSGLLDAGATVLDVACGGGRHTRLLLERGHRVTAVDRDASFVADLAGHPGLAIVEADLEDGAPWPFAGRHFDAVVVTNYLHRPLFPALIAAVAPGGLLIYETFARGNERFTRPRNPDHLLEPGELLRVTEGRLQVVAYEHGHLDTPRPAVAQRLCATRSLEPQPLNPQPLNPARTAD
ncbi:MAG: class I SAM-dependent methyltransferase [Alphaproteobacteria bacterium]